MATRRRYTPEQIDEVRRTSRELVRDLHERLDHLDAQRRADRSRLRDARQDMLDLERKIEVGRAADAKRRKARRPKGG